MAMTTRSRISALLVAATAACGGGSNKQIADLTKPVTGPAANNAERAFKDAAREKQDQNYIEATRLFEYVRNNFPYSQYAALSELGLADMSYDREDYAAAATAYQDFVKAHPSHTKADYAAFRVGLAHFQDKPSDMFLLPPSYEKDQAPIRLATEAFQRFLVSYPKSDLVPRAKELVAQCRERLVAHERYVAGFYEKRGAWKGAAGRLIGIADAYGDLQDGKVRGDALWRAGLAYRNARDIAGERLALTRLVQESPGDPHRRDAEAMLKALPPEAPKPAPQSATPATETAPAAPESAPATPAETPGAPQERPQADPPPGEQPPVPLAPRAR
jgi:outer membrane protein assembly factor BamD